MHNMPRVMTDYSAIVTLYEHKKKMLFIHYAKWLIQI